MTAADDVVAFAALVEDPRWVAWKPVLRGGKPTKVPFDPITGKAAKSDDPSTWAPFQAAQQRARKLGPTAGVGYVLGDIDPDLMMLGIDCDACLHPESGEALDWACAILEHIDSYAEISPSSTGLKLFAYAAIEHRRPFLDRLGLAATQWGSKRVIKGTPPGQEHSPAIEVYTSHRYFAVTAVHWPSSAKTIKILDWRALQWLADYILQVTEAPRASAQGGRSNGHDTSRSGQAFRRAAELRRQGCSSFEELVDALENDPDPAIRDWVEQKGRPAGGRELRLLWNKTAPDADADTDWGDPDLEVLRLHRRAPPELPLDCFGPWASWLVEAAHAAACPIDYVTAPLLATVSVLIGHARWARAVPGWSKTLWKVKIDPLSIGSHIVNSVTAPAEHIAPRRAGSHATPLQKLFTHRVWWLAPSRTAICAPIPPPAAGE